MRVADTVFVSMILILYFRWFDFKFYLKKGDAGQAKHSLWGALADDRLIKIMSSGDAENVGLRPPNWLWVIAKTIIVISPVPALLIGAPQSKPVQLLGFAGLTVMLGPATTRGSANLEDAPGDPRFREDIVGKVIRLVSYGIADKLQMLFLGLVILVVLAAVRFVTGWSLAIPSIISRAPYFPPVYGREIGGLIADTAWVLIIVSLSFKVFFSVLNTPHSFWGSTYQIGMRGIVAFAMLTVILEYTGFIGFSDHGFGIALLMSIMLHRP